LALTPQSNEAFLREVDDELRRDQMLSFWQRYGKLLIGAIVLGLAAFAGFLYWQHRNVVAAGEQGERLQAAYDQLAAGSDAQAAPTLDALSKSKADGYRALALFAQGDEILAKGDTRGAAAKFAAVAADQSLAKPFRDLALIRQTSVEFDSLKPDVVIERLRPLTIPGSAWYGSAGELTAIARMKQGQTALAKQMFSQLGKDASVPEPIRQRAVQMAGLVGTGSTPQNEGSPTK
jgi:hypothetical protein